MFLNNIKLLNNLFEMSLNNVDEKLTKLKIDEIEPGMFDLIILF